MKKCLAFLLTALLPLLAPNAWAQERWERLSQGILDRDFSLILVSPSDPRILFASTQESLYRSLDGGGHWEKIFEGGPLKTSEVKGLYFDERQGTLYLLTSGGVYRTPDPQHGWDRVFTPPSEEEMVPLAFSTHPGDSEILYLGTQEGLYWSLDRGVSWLREPGRLGARKISFLLHHPENPDLLFVAASDGLYRTAHAGSPLERIWALSDVRDEEADLTEAVPFREIRVLRTSPVEPNLLFFGTDRGLFVSHDQGIHWESFPAAGLESLEVRDLQVSPKDGTVFASTDAGIFRFDDEEKVWMKIFQGLPGMGPARISLSSGQDEILYAACREGLFRWVRSFSPIEIPHEYFTLNPSSLAAVQTLLQKEPTVLEVQKAVIRYAGASPWKARRWHWITRLRGLVPRLSLSRDISVSPNLHVDQGGTKDPDIFVSGPDEIRRSRDLTLNWDLADLVWNRDQVSIDSRANSTVQLRDQILSGVTRLYFERRRLLLELYLNRPGTSKAYLELLLRIDELTAQMDALTGGFFTRELRKRGLSYE